LSDYRTDSASLDRAAGYADKLVKVESPIYWDTAGWVYYRRGEYDKALPVLKKVVESLPQAAVFQYHLGMAYLKSGDTKDARTHLAKALEERVTADWADDARKALDGLK
jgi:predicted Zn-dependent protease